MVKNFIKFRISPTQQYESGYATTLKEEEKNGSKICPPLQTLKGSL